LRPSLYLHEIPKSCAIPLSLTFADVVVLLAKALVVATVAVLELVVAVLAVGLAGEAAVVLEALGLAAVAVVCCVNATDVDPTAEGLDVVGLTVDAAVMDPAALVGEAAFAGDAVVLVVGFVRVGFPVAVMDVEGFTAAVADGDVVEVLEAAVDAPAVFVVMGAVFTVVVATPALLGVVEVFATGLNKSNETAEDRWMVQLQRMITFIKICNGTTNPRTANETLDILGSRFCRDRCGLQDQTERQANE
jgi:hypothetical protein